MNSWMIFTRIRRYKTFKHLPDRYIQNIGSYFTIAKFATGVTMVTEQHAVTMVTEQHAHEIPTRWNNAS